MKQVDKNKFHFRIRPQIRPFFIVPHQNPYGRENNFEKKVKFDFLFFSTFRKIRPAGFVNQFI